MVKDTNSESMIQFFKFILVGGSNAIVYYLIYSGSLLCFRHYEIFHIWDYQIAQILGFFISVLWAFVLNRKLVFRSDSTSLLKALFKFYTSYAFTGLVMNSVLLYVWKYMGVSDFIAPIINICNTTPVNFCLSKFWTFREK